MRVLARTAAGRIAGGMVLAAAAIAHAAGTQPQSTTAYALTIQSSNPFSGVAIGVSKTGSNAIVFKTTTFKMTVASGTSMTLSAPAKVGGNDFVSWKGCTHASGLLCTAVVKANMTVAADYAAPFTLTVESANPASGVAILVAPKDKNGAANGTTKFTRSYLPGTVVTLTAPAKLAHSAFSKWSGCKTFSTVTCKVVLAANTTITANYTPVYSLTVESFNPAAGVAIGVAPADHNGASKGTTKFMRTYLAGTAVTLTALEKSGNNTFAGWSGCAPTGGVTCKITVKSNATVIARYSIPGKIAPSVAVTPSLESILTTQSLSVTVAVAGPSGKPMPSGSVKLASGSYSSASVALAGGRATIVIPAGALAAGADTLTATFTPNSSASSTYQSAIGSATVTATTPPPVYTLTIDSAHPSSGIPVSSFPADNSNTNYGATPFTLKFNAGATVKLTATTPSGSYSYVSWSGCASSTNGGVCDLQVNSNMTVTANYNQPSITAVKIAPNPAAATIGVPLQLSATVVGTGNISQGVTWALTGAGTLSPTGLYTTPYPAPATVTITATSTQAPSIGGSVTVTLSPPATATGPALSVDTGNQTHAISPLIYGMNAYVLDTTTATTANIAIARWGGDDTSRYNYLANTSNSASDWYFESGNGSGGLWPDGDFSDYVTTAASHGIKTVGTIPVLGWVTSSNASACSYPSATYPDQYAFSPDGRNCGDGEYSNQSDIGGNDPTVTSIAEPPPAAPAANAVNTTWADGTWPGSWVQSLVDHSQTGASGGVTIWDLDNEPAWWDAVHRDVHPSPSTYDEVTNGGIGTALAIKTVDPTAQVSGPVMDYWWNYFYSKKDIENGWGSGPCYQPWDHPADRQAHGGVPMIEYYLQQFKAAESTYGLRLLDYVTLHTYFAASYNGGGVGLTSAGDTGEQQARMNSTRVFWDSTYTDPNYPQPNYSADPNFTSSCDVPPQAPQLIHMLQTWAANDYPGTKTAIDEYNFGGMESINGAVTQADILGIFGREGLNMATLWPTTNYSQQVPGTMAFAMFRNYDGAKSAFGDIALASTSADQGKLSVYGAHRTADGAFTVMVVNKTYGTLNSILSLDNLTVPSGTKAQVFQYSGANLNAIASMPAVAVTPPASAGAPSTIAAAFPAQSVTLLIVPGS